MTLIDDGVSFEWKCEGGCQIRRRLPDDPVSMVELDALFHLTHIDNVPGILRHGLFSHTAMQDRSYTRIDNGEVQNRRRGARVPGGRSAHDYVPLFFNGRPPMLYVCRKEYGEASICRIEIFKSILTSPGALICDRNVAAISQQAQWAGAPVGIELLSRNAITNRWDPRSNDTERKQMAQAELLVPDFVEPDRIRSVLVMGRAIPPNLKNSSKVRFYAQD